MRHNPAIIGFSDQNVYLDVCKKADEAPNDIQLALTCLKSNSSIHVECHTVSLFPLISIQYVYLCHSAKLFLRKCNWTVHVCRKITQAYVINSISTVTYPYFYVRQYPIWWYNLKKLFPTWRFPTDCECFHLVSRSGTSIQVN